VACSGTKVELFGRGHREGQVSKFFVPAELGWQGFESPVDERPLGQVT
jgi:hypothetical protein